MSVCIVEGCLCDDPPKCDICGRSKSVRHFQDPLDGPCCMVLHSVWECRDNLRDDLDRMKADRDSWKEAWHHQRDVTAEVAFGRLTVAGRRCRGAPSDRG